jgi:hypothetical protein
MVWCGLPSTGHPRGPGGSGSFEDGGTSTKRRWQRGIIPSPHTPCRHELGCYLEELQWRAFGGDLDCGGAAE